MIDGSSSEAPILTEVEHPQGRMSIRQIEGTEKDLGYVWLGVETKLGGKTIDTSERELPEAGIVLAVDQASYGYTGISARGLEGYKVAALGFDPDTNVPSWIEPRQDSGSVTVASDRGNIQTLNPDIQLSTEAYGNPGVRAGVVRVVDPHGK